MVASLINNDDSINCLDDLRNRPIVIDSCILLYCESTVFKTEVRKILRKLTDNGNNLRISEITSLEVLKNSEKDNRGYFFNLIDYIPNIAVEKNVLFNAFALFSAYKKKNISNFQKIPLGDLIVGGTCLYLKDSLFLTCDKTDFKNQFWNVVKSFPVIYKLGEDYCLQNFYLFEVNRNLVLRNNDI